MDRPPRPRLAVAVALAAAACATAPADAFAERTVHVTTTKDLSAGPGDPGGCAGGGECSLRQALVAARGADTTVVLPAGAYALTGGELDVVQIAGRLTIAGAGAAQTVITQETGRRRVLNVHVSGQVALSGVTLTGGEVVGADGADGTAEQPAPVASAGRPGDPGEGGGVYSTGDLTLTDVTVSGNAATGGDGGDGGTGFALPGAPGGVGGAGRGGGIWSNGTLRLERVRVSGNRVRGGAAGSGGTVAIAGTATTGGPAGSAGTGTGGGVHLAGGTLTVVDSWLEGNVATGGAGGVSYVLPRTPPAPPTGLPSPSGAGQGGGLGAGAGSLTITGSTVSHNVATGGGAPPGEAAPVVAPARGGGLHLTVPVTVVRSTVAENVAGGSELTGNRAEGGGIWTTGGGTLVATTVASNVADADNRGAPVEAGGNVRADGARLALRGSLLAGGEAATAANCSGNAVADLGGNVQDGPVAQCAGTLVADAAPAKVADDGGPTPTAALAPDSPAVDAGSCVDAADRPLLSDQRGFARPVGPACDAGAYELQPPPPTAEPPTAGEGERGPGAPDGGATGQRPAAAPDASAPLLRAPSLTAAAVTPAAFQVRRARAVRAAGGKRARRPTGGATLSFALDRAARVTARVERSGRHVATLPLGRFAAGTSRRPLDGRVGGRALAPGRYRLTLTALAAGRAGERRTVAFTVRKG